tara:strand:+ start:394 stop:1104 length:711 start_codon:yes stop_codon:yes gene_type:complete
MNDINRIKIYADGADIESFIKFKDNNIVKGFTTNPSLMRQAGIKNYKNFALEVLDIIKDKEISFEVFADDLNEMEDQAREISSWGKNIAIKIPITNTKSEDTTNIVSNLTSDNIKCNVTAVFTRKQWNLLKEKNNNDAKLIVSIFAGRIADTGINPELFIKEAVDDFKDFKNTEILWASPREIFNLFQAINCGCHIITLPNSLLNKLELQSKDLTEYSLETVKMFYEDAVKSGFKI